MATPSDSAIDRLTRRLLGDRSPARGRSLPPEAAEAASDPERRWGRYVVIEQIGEGGSSRVYRAWQQDVARFVALKVLKPQVPVEWLRREAQCIASLDDARIPHVYEIGEWNGHSFVAMQLIRGRTVDKIGLSPSLAVAVMCEAAGAVGRAHEQGVVHRDIKPGNIMLATDGRVFVTDFGIARCLDLETTIVPQGVAAGTPSFMAPEQLRGDAAAFGPWTDVWGLGATLYTLLSGGPPRPNEGDYGVHASLLPTVLPPGRGSDAELLARVAPVLRSCLAVDWRQRYRNGIELEVALRDAFGAEAPVVSLATLSVSSVAPPQADFAVETPEALRFETHSSASRPARQWQRWRMTVAATAVVAVLAAVAGLVWFGPSPSNGDREPPAAATSSVSTRLESARAHLGHGERDLAIDLLQAHLAEQPGDPHALALLVLAVWQNGDEDVGPHVVRAQAAALDPGERAFVLGIGLIYQRREQEAIAYMRAAGGERSRRPEILYALGEALWHGGNKKEGMEVLRRAFDTDPGWYVALDHVSDYYLAEGTPGELAPVITRLREVDVDAAAALEGAMLCAERRYGEAAGVLRAILRTKPESALLWMRLSEALAQGGDIDAAEHAAKKAFDLAPVDTRAWGTYGHWTEFLLYRGDVESYMLSVGDRRNRVRDLAVALWDVDSAPEPKPLNTAGMRANVVGLAVMVLLSKGEERALYWNYPDPQVRPLGEGLAAARSGDVAKAVAAYRHGLEGPSGGQLRMLLSYLIARSLHGSGDIAGAARACDEVIHPRIYLPYRAVVLPDCLLWTGEATGDSSFYQRLVGAWRGDFAHPAVAAARERLGPRGSQGVAGHGSEPRAKRTSSASAPPAP